MGGWEAHAQQQNDDGHHEASTGKVVQRLSCRTRSSADEISHNRHHERLISVEK